MISIREFQFFDPDGEVTITSGHLPHWQQPGATYFITYRTIDSIPQAAMNLILRSRDDWLSWHGIDATKDEWHRQLGSLSMRLQATFRRMFATEFENQLDQLAGECELRRPELAKIVADSLHHFDGERYRIGAFVVMPNHVHVLARVFPNHAMLDQCYSWKHFQAYRIHQALSLTGHFFQSESFDHLVRDDDHFWKFHRYIAANPEKARLSEGEYSIYLPDIQ